MPAATTKSTKPRPDSRELTRSLHRSHGSFELAFAPVIMALLGLWLDRTVGTVPLFTLVFAVIGVLGAFAKVYYQYKAAMAELDDRSVWSSAPAQAAVSSGRES